MSAALLAAARKADEQISAIHAAFGAPGDHGYESREGKALYALYKFQVELRAAINNERAADPDGIAAILQAFHSETISSSQATDRILAMVTAA